MNHVLDEDVDWLRHSGAAPGTLRYAVPDGFEAYGVLDLPPEIGPVESWLLRGLGVDPADRLIAGWIDRGPWLAPEGDEHVLYSGWKYRFRRVHGFELPDLPTEGEGSFPDVVFPPDRSWVVSLLWDDQWRSIGADQASADRLTSHLANFEQVDPDADLAETGRVPN